MNKTFLAAIITVIVVVAGIGFYYYSSYGTVNVYVTTADILPP